MKVIVITGTPGCGKTTISKKLSKKINAKCISLNDLGSSEDFIEGYDEERDTYITNTEKLTTHLKELLNRAKKEETRELIIEGHFADIVPSEYIDIVIILRCHPDILKKRLEKREYKSKKIRENIQAEILGNAANYIFEKDLKCPIYELDTTNKTIDHTTTLIQKIIKDKEAVEKYKFGKIDWLQPLSEEDRLNEFFN